MTASLRRHRNRGLVNHGLRGEILTARQTGDIPPPPIGEATRRHQNPWSLFQSGDHPWLRR